jgi:hypothetical protein
VIIINDIAGKNLFSFLFFAGFAGLAQCKPLKQTQQAGIHGYFNVVVLDIKNRNGVKVMGPERPGNSAFQVLSIIRLCRQEPDFAEG